MFKFASKGIVINFFALSCFVHIYGKDSCPFCTRAEKIMSKCGIRFIFHDTNAPSTHNKVKILLEERGINFKTVPQIFFCTQYIGGYINLLKLIKERKFHKSLEDNKIKYSSKCNIS